MPAGRARIVLASVVTAVALLSVWHEARGTWHDLDCGYDTFSAYSAGERRAAPITGAGFPAVVGDLFRFASSNLQRGDRVYFQVPHTKYGTLDLHGTIGELGRYFFLPAVEVDSVDDATVVFSYNADPSKLRRRFVGQLRFGPSTLSRIAFP
jgi:hypothetical protein